MTSTKAHPSTTTTTKPPIHADPTATIHDKATFTGTHPITISARAIIHPFAKLDSTHAPIEIGEGAVVWEKAIVGAGPSSDPGDGMTAQDGDSDGDVAKTVIGAFAHVGPHSTVHASACLGSYSTLEVSGVVKSGATVGDFAKVSTGCVVTAGVHVKAYTTVFMLGEKQMERVNETVQGDVEGVRGAFVRSREKEVALLRRVVKGGIKWTT